jgi:hypothetical protein
MRLLHSLASGPKIYINQGDRPLRNADNFMLPNPHTELFKKSPLYNLPENETILMMPDILETEQHLKLPSNLAC